MAKPFDSMTADKAAALIPARLAFAPEVDKILAGDLYLAGDGWIGEMPLDPAAVLGLIRGIIGENLIDEIVDRGVSGVVGKEAIWRIVYREGSAPATPATGETIRLQPAEAETAPTSNEPPADEATVMAERQQNKELEDINQDLTAWWDRNDMIGLLQRVAARRVVEGRAPLYITIPHGLLDEKNKITPAPRTLAEALRYIFVDDLTTSVACVHRDRGTRMEIGIVIEKDAAGRFVADVSYLDESGKTILKVLGKRNASSDVADVETEAQTLEATEPYGVIVDMQGRLFMHDRRNKPIITQQIVQLQKGLTLALTQLIRNINLAGHRQVNYLNAEPPGKWVDAAESDPDAKPWPGGGFRRFQPTAIRSGPGVQNFISGYDVFDENGKKVSVTNPNVNVVDPVTVDHFERTYGIIRAAALMQANQAHVLGNVEEQSGISRVQARADFKTSLGPLKTAIDDAGRWMLEVVLMLAGVLMNQPQKYANVRADFGCVLNLGPLTPEEAHIIMAMYEAELLDDETAMSMLGIDDPESLKQKIRQMKLERRKDDTEGATAVMGSFGLLNQEARTAAAGNPTPTTTINQPANAGGDNGTATGNPVQ